MINTANLNEARKQIQNTKEKPIIVKSQNPEFDRKILEFGNFNILLSVEKIKGKDNSKYLNSGLNHVLAKIAAKNKIAMGINIEEISRLEKKQKALLLSIIKQNIKTKKKKTNNPHKKKKKKKRTKTPFPLWRGFFFICFFFKVFYILLYYREQ